MNDKLEQALKAYSDAAARLRADMAARPALQATVERLNLAVNDAIMASTRAKQVLADNLYQIGADQTALADAHRRVAEAEAELMPVTQAIPV